MGLKTIFLITLGLFLWGCSTSPSVPPQTLAVEYYNLGNAYFQLKMYKEAGDYYKKALSYDSSNNQATYNLARSLSEQGQWKEATDQLEALQFQDPKNLMIQKTLAYLLYLQDKKEEALALYTQAFEAGSGDLDSLKNAGIIAKELGKNAQALGFLEKYQASGGVDGKVLTLLGTLYLDEKKDQEGVNILGAQVTSLGDMPETLLLLAQAYVRLEIYDKALDTFKALIEADGKKSIKRPDIWFDFGMLIEIKIQDPTGAMAYFQRAVDQGFADKTKVSEFLETKDLIRRETFVKFFEEKKLWGEVPAVVAP